LVEVCIIIEYSTSKNDYSSVYTFKLYRFVMCLSFLLQNFLYLSSLPQLHWFARTSLGHIWLIDNSSGSIQIKFNLIVSIIGLCSIQVCNGCACFFISIGNICPKLIRILNWQRSILRSSCFLTCIVTVQSSCYYKLVALHLVEVSTFYKWVVLSTLNSTVIHCESCIEFAGLLLLLNDSRKHLFQILLISNWHELFNWDFSLSLLSTYNLQIGLVWRGCCWYIVCIYRIFFLEYTLVTTCVVAHTIYVHYHIIFLWFLHDNSLHSVF